MKSSKIYSFKGVSGGGIRHRLTRQPGQKRTKKKQRKVVSFEP